MYTPLRVSGRLWTRFKFRASACWSAGCNGWSTSRLCWYVLGFWHSTSRVDATVRISAKSKQEVRDLSKAACKETVPIMLSLAYDELGLLSESLSLRLRPFLVTRRIASGVAMRASMLGSGFLQKLG